MQVIKDCKVEEQCCFFTSEQSKASGFHLFVTLKNYQGMVSKAGLHKLKIGLYRQDGLSSQLLASIYHRNLVPHAIWGWHFWFWEGISTCWPTGWQWAITHQSGESPTPNRGLATHMLTFILEGCQLFSKPWALYIPKDELLWMRCCSGQNLQFQKGMVGSHKG